MHPSPDTHRNIFSLQKGGDGHLMSQLLMYMFCCLFKGLLGTTTMYMTMKSIYLRLAQKYNPSSSAFRGIKLFTALFTSLCFMRENNSFDFLLANDSKSCLVWNLWRNADVEIVTILKQIM